MMVKTAKRKKVTRILVIKLGALGDFVQALGPMAAIREHHPNAYITLLTTTLFQSFAEQSGYFNEIWIDTKPRWYQLKDWVDLKKKLNEAHFSRIYDLQNNDRTGLYFKLLKTREKPEWVGTAKGCSHRNTSPLRTAGHAFDGHIQTLGLAGIKNIRIDTMEWVKADIGHLGLPETFALIVPGCAPDRPEKQWPAESYGALCRWFFQNGVTPVILGTKSERTIARTICKICPDTVNLIEKTTLPEIITLARKASIAIGNDTGPMHLIAASGCKNLTLFSGHSNPEKHAPIGKESFVIPVQNLKDLTVDTVIEKCCRELFHAENGGQFIF